MSRGRDASKKRFNDTQLRWMNACEKRGAWSVFQWIKIMRFSYHFDVSILSIKIANIHAQMPPFSNQRSQSHSARRNNLFQNNLSVPFEMQILFNSQNDSNLCRKNKEIFWRHCVNYIQLSVIEYAISWTNWFSVLMHFVSVFCGDIPNSKPITLSVHAKLLQKIKEREREKKSEESFIWVY